MLRESAGSIVTAFSGSETTEIAYALGRLLRGGLAAHSAVLPEATSDALEAFRLPLSGIAEAEIVVVVGDEPVVERAPIVDLWIREARRRGAEIVVFSPTGTEKTAPGSGAATCRELAAGRSGLAKRLAAAERAVLIWSGSGGGGGARIAELAHELSLEAKPGSGAFHLPAASNPRGVALGWAVAADADETNPEPIELLIVSGDEAAASADVRALAESAKRVLVLTMFHELAGGWADLILPSTGSLERDGTSMNLEGRVQRLRRAVSPPCPDELAWISKLAARFDVDVAPHAMGVFAELSEHLFRDLTHEDIGLHAPLPARQPYVVPEPATTPAPPDEAGGALRLQRYRPLFAGPAVERVPELGFQRPGPDVELSAADAESLGIASGDQVVVRSNGTSVELRARINRRLVAGVARVADEHAGDLHPDGRGREAVTQPVDWWVSLIQAFIVINLVMVTFAYLTLAERKIMARMQLRYGPNRAGFRGSLQPIADLLKLLNKESFQPTEAINWAFVLGPFLATFTALVTFSVIPFGPGWEVGGVYIPGQVADLDIALILIFAIGSIGVYGFILGGWSSDSKYALLGSMRTCAQLVSYEVSLALSVLGVVIMAGNALAHRDRRRAGRHVVVRASAVRRADRLPARGHGRDRPCAVRPSGSRAGARRGLPHGVRRDALRALLDVRVHQPHHAVRAVRDALPRRLARPRVRRAVVDGAAVVHRQARDPPLPLHLDADDAPAAALRPAHVVRLEGAAAGRDDQRRHHGDPGGGAVTSRSTGTLKGFGVTFRQIFRKPITQQYPEYKRPVYPRFRGRHRLWKHENGLEKCVGCSLCAAACPADCIRVVAEENTAENRVSAGERYARIYEINMSRCIFCGYCELACPFDAITLGNEFEIAEYSRDDLIYTKDMLLAEPIKRVPVADADRFDTPEPSYKTHS